MEKNPHISEAIGNVGGLSATARLLGIERYQTVQQWITAGQVPAQFCVPLEQASGVSRHKLRPKDGRLIWPDLRVEPAS